MGGDGRGEDGRGRGRGREGREEGRETSKTQPIFQKQREAS